MIKFYSGYTSETLEEYKGGFIRGVGGRQDHAVQWKCPSCGSGKVQPIYPKLETKRYRTFSLTDPKYLPGYDKTMIWECSTCGNNEMGEHFVRREIRLPAYALSFFIRPRAQRRLIMLVICLIIALIVYALIRAVLYLFS